MRQRLDQRTVEALVPRERGDLLVWDSSARLWRSRHTTRCALFRTPVPPQSALAAQDDREAWSPDVREGRRHARELLRAGAGGRDPLAEDLW